MVWFKDNLQSDLVCFLLQIQSHLKKAYDLLIEQIVNVIRTHLVAERKMPPSIESLMFSSQGNMKNVIDNKEKKYRWMDSAFDFKFCRGFTSMQPVIVCVLKCLLVFPGCLVCLEYSEYTPVDTIKSLIQIRKSEWSGYLYFAKWKDICRRIKELKLACTLPIKLTRFYLMHFKITVYIIFAIAESQVPFFGILLIIPFFHSLGRISNDDDCQKRWGWRGEIWCEGVVRICILPWITI